MTTLSPNRPSRRGAEAGPIERWAARALPVVLGACAFAISFRHVRRVALDHGADQAASWAIAISVELLAIAAALETRRRRRLGQSVLWPTVVLLVGIAATVSANLETATAPGWGTAVAVWPAACYLLAASLHTTRPTSPRVPDVVPDDEMPGPVQDELAPWPADQISDVPRDVVDEGTDDDVPDVPIGGLDQDVVRTARRIYRELSARGEVRREDLIAAVRDAGHPVASSERTAVWRVARTPSRPRSAEDVTR
ncbi:DUF2637 domain-containing protein [Frankia sp. Cr1]|uniref:DUF2637 domain-containing protein n=1 Tax=Frankia sp. Cr1 TaxID=3073931 RepID=UPI002AD4BE60|nr:DUF2637 domain-containing protein [Frankia sp. Cr1]